MGIVQLDDGMLVESDVLRIAEKIQEYDPNLKLQYLERPESLGDPPFRVLEKCKDGKWRVAFTAWQLDDRLLERIMAADTRIQDLDAIITNKNIKAREDKNRRYQEQMDEAAEMVKAIASSPKDTYTIKLNGEVKKFRM